MFEEEEDSGLGFDSFAEANNRNLGDKQFGNKKKIKSLTERIYEGGENESQEGAIESYVTRTRPEGSGPVRIGKEIALGADIYSILFASCYSHELVLYYEHLGKKGEEGAHDSKDAADESSM